MAPPAEPDLRRSPTAGGADRQGKNRRAVSPAQPTDGAGRCRPAPRFGLSPRRCCLLKGWPRSAAARPTRSPGGSCTKVRSAGASDIARQISWRHIWRSGPNRRSPSVRCGLWQSAAESPSAPPSTASRSAWWRSRPRGIALHKLTFAADFGRRLDYYTGFVFEIHRNDGAGQPIVGGGRYDRLMSMLGADGIIPAVGFAIWLERTGVAP